MLTEVAIYCRGGQGGVTTARVLATAAMIQGYYSQAMPQFGPERRGAIVNAYIRISDKPIRRRSPVNKPDVIAIFDERIKVDCSAELVVLNSPYTPSAFERVCSVDATKIAERHGLVNAGWVILSPPMSGALAKALEIELSALERAMHIEGKGAEKSFDAAKEAYEVIRC